MSRTVLVAGIGWCLATVAAVADEAKGEKVSAVVSTDYFEKNNSGLKGDVSYLVFTQAEAFDKIFQARPPLMGGNKPVLLPADVFDKHVVATVITRGNALTTYQLSKVTRDGETLYVEYQTQTGPPSTAMFASPLIVAAPKDQVKKVVFIANGKTAQTVAVK
ncbi:MAG: hypothetical protein RMJ56_08225 [Gemmataceae bacterium]|nr:hypothetical protein [Gemmata sp.]MDW8197577.1 hypothetical protein [Gemmataceae bacterium]